MSLGYSTKDNASNIPALRFKNGLLSFPHWGFNPLMISISQWSITCSNVCHVSNHGWHRWKPSLVWPCATCFSKKCRAVCPEPSWVCCLTRGFSHPEHSVDRSSSSWLCRAAGPVQAISQKIEASGNWKKRQAEHRHHRHPNMLKEQDSEHMLCPSLPVADGTGCSWSKLKSRCVVSTLVVYCNDCQRPANGGNSCYWCQTQMLHGMVYIYLQSWPICLR
jgi:hypothetical protein